MQEEFYKGPATGLYSLKIFKENFLAIFGSVEDVFNGYLTSGEEVSIHYLPDFNIILRCFYDPTANKTKLDLIGDTSTVKNFEKRILEAEKRYC